jgi:hypothetical protein
MATQEHKMLKAFGVEKTVEEHLVTLIETNSVTLPNGQEMLTDIAKVCQAALNMIKQNQLS